jgi:hypothetical protein
LLILFLVALISRETAVATQAEMVKKSLGRILFADRKNALSALLDQDLQKQIAVLGSTVRLLSEQTQNLKQELDIKAEEFTKVGSVLESNFSENLQKLSSDMVEFTKECQNATALSGKISDTLTVQTDSLRQSAQETADILNPLINETIASAEHFENILQNNKNYIEQANADLNRFCEQNNQQLTSAVDTLTGHQTRIEQSFLQTADRCREIYQQLDSGISHIESSLKTHKENADAQAALIDKNSTYLDNKLGEYGRLISMEVEEMVKRSSTLEMNVKRQIDALVDAGQQTDRILDGVNNSLEEKSGKAVKNIEAILSTLEEEVAHLSEIVKHTENKNNEVAEAADKTAQKIGAISQELGAQVDSLKNRSVEAIDRFNEVSGLVQKNATQLSETANIIATKGKENNESLLRQNADLVQTTSDLEKLKNYFTDIGTAMKQAQEKVSQLFATYKDNVVEYNGLVNRQLEDLSESRRQTEQAFEQLRQKYTERNMTNFIDGSSVLIQNLSNLSIDINHIFNDDQDETLWKKFYSGDYQAFARHIVKNMTRKQIVRLRDEYEKNEDFRQMADRYLSEFETLLQSAKSSERPQVMMALLSGSDLGKVYYIMARALDRLG